MKIIINSAGEMMDIDSSILNDINSINKIGDTYFINKNGFHFSVHENFYIASIRENKINYIVY